ncbi:ABC transporter substrate-binding protein [Morganella morganii]
MKKMLFSLITISVFTFSAPIFANVENNELDYASTKDIRDINPHLYSGEMAAQNMVFESLVLNTNEGVKPFLAKSWDISSDGKSYIFHLREDVKFTDGEPFNAQAVKLNTDESPNDFGKNH